ncbi:FAD-dependent monooxygenase [Paenibacillus shenyangensis]|uniref:FAD-dependent monooxygenase n=1 Tax=Paenibacillus sp. A9 TaxID=1284352 RepID=UPI0003721EFD|nr:FAD-dependent monooxygenase [Paenibacillus sp. A9]
MTSTNRFEEQPQHHPQSCDVLIVGAGPTGLTLAIELMRRGVSCRIIDKAPKPSKQSKALGIMARTLELLDHSGITEQLVKHGHPVKEVQVRSGSHLLADVKLTPIIRSRYPYILTLPQSDTERILYEHLDKLGGQVERSTELLSLEQLDAEAAVTGSAEASVKATIATSGGSEVIQARWVVGCDGAHSKVRHLLSLSFDGNAIDQQFGLADVEVQWPVKPQGVRIYLHEGHIAAFFPMPDERYRVIIAAPPDVSWTGGQRQDQLSESRQPTSPDQEASYSDKADAGDAYSLESTGPDGSGEITLTDIQRILDICMPAQERVTLHDPSWMAHFRVNERKVKQYRQGAVFLAGDAAHIHSPLGGQGMNTGIQDAVNLGWKLALVCHSQASAAILDSYEEEREPVARALLRWTGLFTRLVISRIRPFTFMRNTAAPLLSSRRFVQLRMAERLSETGIRYPHSQIVRQGKGWHKGMPLAGERAPDGSMPDKGIVSGRHTLLIFPDTTLPPAITTSRSLAYEENLEEEDKRPLWMRVSDAWREVIDLSIMLPDEPLMLPQPLPAHYEVDSDLQMHRLYGMERGGYVLLRPDGYIGFVGSLADELELIGCINQFFHIPARYS